MKKQQTIQGISHENALYVLLPLFFLVFVFLTIVPQEAHKGERSLIQRGCIVYSGDDGTSRAMC